MNEEQLREGARQVTWFKGPSAEPDGVLNACYNALDRHVIHGRAEKVALVTEDRELTFSQLLSEVGAFAGVLRAFGVAIGSEVGAVELPPFEDVVVQLACARLGAVLFREEPPAPAVVVVGTAADGSFGDAPVITVDSTAELNWATVMRAGRTDPAACADVPGEAPLRVVDGTPVPTAAHLVAVAAGEVQDPVLGPLLAGERLDLRPGR